jgi:hypothetical protein
MRLLKHENIEVYIYLLSTITFGNLANRYTFFNLNQMLFEVLKISQKIPIYF